MIYIDEIKNLKLYKSLYTALRGKGLSLISIGY